MTEIDIASDQEHAERGGTAATDLQLELLDLHTQQLLPEAFRTVLLQRPKLLGRPSVARPVFAVVFGPQTGAHKNHFFSIP